MLRELKLIKAYSGIQTSIFKTYRSDSIFYILKSIIAMSILIFLWSNIYSATIVVVYFSLYYLLQSLLSVNTAWSIADDIRQGTIALQMAKPISYKKKLLYEQFGITRVIAIYVCLPILAIIAGIIFVNNLSLELTILEVGILLVNIILSYLFFFYLDVMVGILTFYITYIFGILMLKDSVIVFFTGGYIPIFAFPEVVQYIYTFTPFYYLFYYPIELISGTLTNKEMVLGLIIQIFWLLIIVKLCNVFYNRSIKYIEIAGG